MVIKVKFQVEVFMKVIDYIVFTFLCAIYGVASATANIKMKSWEYWIILGCIVGAFLCGKFA